MSGDKEAQLEEIAQQVRDLEESPLYEYRKQHGYFPVIGEGSLDASIVFIGEAPGEQEAKTGRPFVGNAGQVLDELLESIGIRRDKVYITNVVKDRPPGNRDPTSEEIKLYSPFLERQIELIRPRVIVPLGRFAMDFVLKQFGLAERGQKISDLHGQVLEGHAAYGDVAVVPLYHPAVTFYDPRRKDALGQDVQVLKQFA